MFIKFFTQHIVNYLQILRLICQIIVLNAKFKFQLKQKMHTLLTTIVNILGNFLHVTTELYLITN